MFQKLDKNPHVFKSVDQIDHDLSGIVANEAERAVHAEIGLLSTPSMYSPAKVSKLTPRVLVARSSAAGFER